MKLALALDDLLCDTASLDLEWATKLESNYKKDESFWAALQPYKDVSTLQKLDETIEVYVLANRPKSFFLVTKAWLRNKCGLSLDKEHIVMQAIKRYDCRILGIDALIDSDRHTLEMLSFEQVHPIEPYYVQRDKFVRGMIPPKNVPMENCGFNMIEIVERINASVCV